MVSKMFEGKVAVVTGSQRGIGKCIADKFRSNGAMVAGIDLVGGDCYYGDLRDKNVLERFAAYVKEKFGKIDYLINNAPPLNKGISECSYEEFNKALAVGVTAPFYLAKLFSEDFADGGAIVNISSSRDRMSQPQTESYTAAKGGIYSLTHALAISFAGKIRVNSVSPGWIETGNRHYTGPDAVQQPAGRVGKPDDVADAVLFLCSEHAGFITGTDLCVDGGMTKQMIYHGEYGWEYSEKSDTSRQLI